jgi:hypothetical protein
MAATPKDWADLGAMVQRAARRALAIHLVEAAAQTAAPRVDTNEATLLTGGNQP